MKVLVCGGREYNDKDRVFDVLDSLHSRHEFELLIQGGARGVDSLAYTWAKIKGIPQQTFKAEWNRYGRNAGRIRNNEMLKDGKPELIVAFPGGPGTAHMVSIGRLAGITVTEIR